jgi:2-oxoglutarate dehydrogenase E2 component (dihydrolipoamide succinyltransferase)
VTTGTAVDVVMPQMGVSVSEGTITKWLKSVGEEVAADEALLEISTDKVDTEVPSPASGVVTEILVQEGETVEVGARLAVVSPEGGSAPAAELPEPATAAASAESSDVGAEGESATAAHVEEAAPAAEPTTPATPEPTTPATPEPAPAAESRDGGEDGRAFVSPVVARIASEHGVDVSKIDGSGRGGRVTKKDILAYVEAGAGEEQAATAAGQATPEVPPQPAPTQPAEPPKAPAPAAPPAPVEPQEGEHLEPMTAMRRGIAEHMRRSLDTSAHVTSAIEADMSKVVAIREQLKRNWQTTYGVNPTYLAFVARAAVDTLRDYPWVNGEIRGDQIVTRPFVNLGFAVELADGKGLIVPVVRNAETLNLLGMAKAIADVAKRARDKQLLPDDVIGGTFTVTNPGGYGTFHGTPIISQPQSGILGTYAVVKRPWVVQDELGQDVIAVRPIMNVTLTYDHRLVDGAYAGRFLRDLRERLQTWDESAY